eukprot:TRINITY_DN2807_c0_g1_i1.p3 TRINITY_DN2807_c0_g1~~TRINITY_DN2807_c0_g1_i1.p3  ORF type:complete len:51 (+),score=2.15 TRINITY_DN2807_c0_g1_i1:109-261(+)
MVIRASSTSPPKDKFSFHPPKNTNCANSVRSASTGARADGSATEAQKARP